MKNFIVAFRLTMVLCMFLYLGYVMVLWIFGKVAGPGNGNAEVVEVDGKVVGVANVGQYFTKDIYFWVDPRVQAMDMMLPTRVAATRDLRIPNILSKWRHV